LSSAHSDRQIKIKQHAYQHEGTIYASVLWKNLVKMSPAQIVDNLTRTLYEINQNKDVLFAVPSVELELVCR